MNQDHDGMPGDAGACLAFPGTASAALDRVGGKAHALIRLAAEGHAVPPGVVLTRDFFAPWIDQMLALPEWPALQDASAAQRRILCGSLKQYAAGLSLDTWQQRVLHAMRVQLAGLTPGRWFAVRSSSPQEDLHGASFAGGYATCLGVGMAGLEPAIRTCFASMFDERVIAYQALRGMRMAASPGMAVVVQAQIASEVSGVAFSLNPLSNDYDEAVVDANWGLGETVVSGEVSPDHWVLDKLTGAVIEHGIGSKQISRWQHADGQLIDRAGHRCAEACLTPLQLEEVRELLQRVEADFGHPVDIEWAIADGTLHLLQARPVTAFVPLPARLTTEPGARRRLYMDVALSSGLTINAPISPMGLDAFRRLLPEFSRLAFGPVKLAPGADDALILLDGGRMYLDFSNTLWLSSPRRMAASMRMSDATMARIVETVDGPRYRSRARPTWARWRMLLRLPGTLWRLRRVLANTLMPFLAPQRTWRRIAGQLAAVEQAARSAVDDELPLDAFWERWVRPRLRSVFEVSLTVVGPGVFAVRAFARLVDPASRRDSELMQCLDRGFEGNVVVDMSIRMHQLACLLTADQRGDAEQLAARLRAGELSADFIQHWNAFLLEFGFRGPSEMDLAHPRYADAPQVALRQIAAMPVDDPDFDPAAAARRQVERRRAAVATVIQRAGPLRRRILQRLNHVVEHFAGLRDTPKHHFLMVLHRLRVWIVREGEQLHRAGRIDDATHVFDLAMQDLAAARADPQLNLRAIRGKRRPYYDTLVSQVVNFPPMIDSRGRIPRPPPRPCGAGEFSGIGLSPGTVSGPARTLRSPHEKPLLKGEVLIAYTTDPGWTPIFANAAAVVLEIGGALQHGAVVARELGLPCVAGIDGISRSVKDGQWLEVDGGSGTLRLLATPATD
jgi:rifampicin phosphotransferase